MRDSKASGTHRAERPLAQVVELHVSALIEQRQIIIDEWPASAVPYSNPLSVDAFFLKDLELRQTYAAK